MPLLQFVTLPGYLMTIPIPNEKTLTVAIHLFSEILLKFAVSQEYYISDNETEFKSKFIGTFSSTT